MAGLMVAGAFLTPVIQVIVERVASGDYKDIFKKRMVNKLEITLNSINQVLDDGETKQYQNPNVRIWLDDIKHEVCEVEQLLDEIATSAQRKSKVKHFFSSLTNQFESRMKDSLDKLEHLLKQNDVLGLKEGTSARNGLEVGPESSKRVPTTSLVDESRILGRNDDKEEIIDFLLLDNGSSCNHAPIISIVGLGGMGKTTLARLVYNDDKVQSNFELKAWIYISNPFDIFGLTKEILEQFKSPTDSESLEILQHQLQQKVMGKKYLLVLDDIWKANEKSWEQLLIPFNKGSPGSKMIVTTRSKDDASAMESAKLVELEQLEESDCWSLFVTHAFHDRNASDYPDLEPIGKMIVDKCGGLPLAVKTMGNLLRKKFSKSEWEKILKTDMWRLSERDSNINPVLRLSYHNLPSNSKRCFAYCSIFPKGYEFDKNKLIKMWMANGLLNSYKSNKSKEELGSGLFDDLESISFFQESLYVPGLFVMHDLVNDLAKSESREFCLQVNGDTGQDISERTRHIWCSLDLKAGDGILKHIYRAKGLHSLLVESPTYGGECFMISNNMQCDMFSKLKYLRMLSFSDYGTPYGELELADEIGNLNLLRYLDLTWTDIKRLPDSICKLYNLERLELKNCDNLTELPLDFYKLDGLRHLNLEGTAIKKMPKQIRKLNHLQTLTNFVVGESSGSDIEELESLNLLQGKISLSGLNNVTDPTHAVKSRLQDKKFLEKIHMIFDGSIVESNVSVLDALQPNINLKRLTIKNYNGNMFPTWIRGCDLPNLISLKLKNCNGIKIFGNNSTNVPFKFLEVLEFDCLSEWEEWVCIEGFPRLKEISINDCPKLKRVSLPQHLPLLQKLFIGGCKMVDVSILNYDKIIVLDLRKYERIMINELSSSLKRFVLSENQYVEFSMDHLINNPFLGVLWLDFKDLVECPSLDLCYNSLWQLSIRGWQSPSLPISLHLFTHLSSLKLLDCPRLESFLIGGLASELWSLDIFNCPKLIASRVEWGLFQLNSLYFFTVSDDFENVESFPEQNLLPPTLKFLKLDKCSKLRILNYKGFLHLKSLGNIWICNCPSLESLPEEGLPNSLSCLFIENCPLLSEKYKKEGGERWHTISHIPTVRIDGIHQH
ncbi:putative disease resistance RPP13-like protein 1 [Vicia villosa]|uniref:putative disease resistance RPP13-like protein 1 n=1 Tax=Vicia villosa TaxID=3911 RepID=UPI00273A7B49|nr:putative disease resistance RPP13-like protein 1 [Vicia villosa]